ncbi:MAG: hypothetical protein K6E10_03480 [Eubacterium sp.]|nr:hypothetical protein [Eubacterium sp.]
MPAGGENNQNNQNNQGNQNNQNVIQVMDILRMEGSQVTFSVMVPPLINVQVPYMSPIDENNKPVIVPQEGSQGYDANYGKILTSSKYNNDYVMRPEQVAKLNKDLDIYESTAQFMNDLLPMQNYLLKDMFSNDEERNYAGDIYNGCGFDISRPGEILNGFIMFAMVEKNYSFEDSIYLLKKEEGRKVAREYFRFCEKNRMMDIQDSEQYKKSIKNWTRLYKKSSEMIKNYNIPHADYTDNKKLKNLIAPYYYISQMGLCGGQVFIQNIMDSHSDIESGRKIVIDELGGQDKLDEIGASLMGLQRICGGDIFSGAYDISSYKNVPFFKGQNEQVKIQVRKKTVHKYFLSKMADLVKGLTVGQAEEKIRNIGEYYNCLINCMDLDILNIPMKEVFDYEAGRNKKKFEERIDKLISKYDKDARRELENHQADIGRGLLRMEDISQDIYKDFINCPDDLASRKSLLEKKTDRGITYKDWIYNRFGNLVSIYGLMPLRDLDNRIYDLIIIDGIPASKLWAEKYKDVQSPVERQDLIQADIMKEILKGEKNIGFLTYKYTQDHKFVEDKTLIALPGKALAQEILDNVRMYKFYTDTQINEMDIVSRNLGENKENSSSYNDLVESVNNLIYALKQSNKSREGYSIPQVQEFISRLDESIIKYLAKKNINEKNRQIAETLKNKVENMKNTYDVLGKHMTYPDILGPKGDFNPDVASYSNLLYVADRCEAFYSKTTPLEEITEEKALSNVNKLIEEEGASLNKEILDSIKNKLTLMSKFSKNLINIDQYNAVEKNLSEEELKELEKIDSLHKFEEGFNEEENIEIRKLLPAATDPLYEERLKAFNELGIRGSRGGTVKSIFLVWAMGHKGYSFRNSIDLLNGSNLDGLINEFVDFCKEHPVNKPGLAPDELKTNVKIWSQIMKNTTDTLKQYYIPDVDYRNRGKAIQYYREFNQLANISQDFLQEFFGRMGGDKIFEGGIGKDGKEYSAKSAREYQEEFIGLKEYNQMHDFWERNSKVFNSAVKAYTKTDRLEEWKNGDPSIITGKLISFAAYDMAFQDIMDKCKGKNLSQMPYSVYAKEVIDVNNREDFVQNYYMNTSIPIDDVFDYLGGNRGKTSPFVQNINTILNPKNEVNRKIPIGHMIGNDVIKEFKQKLAISLNQVPDDKDSMIEFVKGKADDTTNIMLLRSTFEQMFDYKAQVVASSLGIDLLDMIKIDGKKPSELWGSKYEGINEDEVFRMKDYLYMAEIGKAILRGQHEITYTTALLDKDYNIKVKEPVVFSPKREDLVKINDNFIMYKNLFPLIKKKIYDYTSALSSTQEVPKANFGEGVTGSQSYQKMCSALNDCLALVTHDNMPFSGAELRDKLDAFRKASAAYYKRGKTSNPIRLETAKKAAEEIETDLGIIDQLNSAFSNNIATDAFGKSLYDGKFTNISSVLDNYKKLYSNINPIPQLSDAEAKRRINGLADRYNAEAAYNNKLRRTIGKLPAANKGLSASEAAKLYVYQSHKAEIRGKIGQGQNLHDVTVEEINVKKEALNARQLKAEYTKLAENKVFIKMVERYQEYAPAKWAKVLKDTKTLINKFTSELKVFKNIDGEKALENVEKIELLAGDKKQVNDKYTKLGNLVAKQIITAPRNSLLAQGIVAGLIEYSDFEKACEAHLRKNKFLDGGISRTKMTREMIGQKIVDGSLKNEVLAKITKGFTKKVEQKIKQKEAERSTGLKH